MNLLDKLTKVKRLSVSALIFLLFVGLHLFLFNVNAAEWGDSYRILRAAEFLRNFSYPVDEKRPPLFSGILAARPFGMEQIFWGRIVVLGFSVGAFLIFNKLVKRFLKSELARGLALLLFALNPVYLYWSIRVMADIPFSFLVLVVIYLCTIWDLKRLKISNVVILGGLAGLSILMRFEGYILFGAVGLGLLFPKGFENFYLATLFKNPIRFFAKSFKNVFFYTISVSFVVLPYLYFRNPFKSSYLEEPATRAYDFRTFWIYLVSLLFLFGFIPAFYFLIKKRDVILSFFKKNVVIFAFVCVELLLILFWPAAVPRLFVTILPLLIIPLAECTVLYFEERRQRDGFYAGIVSLVLLGAFLVSQYILKLQFLVSMKTFFILVVLVQLMLIYGVLAKNWKVFAGSLVVSMTLWSIASVWVHKDIFISIKSAALYASENLRGRVGYNDISSVADWYLNQNGRNNDVRGIFFDYGKKEDLEYKSLLDKGFDYILMTNEHNTDTTLDIEKRPYLDEIKEFRYLINGKEFWTKVIEVKR